jgi:hypothetical protein
MNVLLQAINDPLMLAPIAIFFVVFGLAIAVTQQQSTVATRLARHHIGGASVIPASSPTRLTSWRTRLHRPAVFDRVAARFNSEKSAAQARTLLNRAGSPMSSEAYARLRLIFTFVLTPAFAKEMDSVISDVLDLLVVCVEGGQSLSAALMQLSNRMDNVAAEEFRHLLADFNTGMSRRDAFNALADRCPSEALGIACTTIIHSDKVGMSLGQTLRVLSDMMRTRRRQAAETKARQAPIKMMPVLVGFMLPTMLALLIGPVALEVMDVFK